MNNKPWEYCDLWRNQSQFLQWLRGQLRQIWKDYPVRIEFKDNQCVKVTPAMKEKYGLHGRTKFAAECVFCKGWFAKSKLEVDHTIGNARLTELSDVQPYMDHLLCPPENMQLACVACHKIKTYAERMGMSFKEARDEKAVIAWTKEHDTNEQKKILTLAGFADHEMNNEENRRISARQLLNPN